MNIKAPKRKHYLRGALTRIFNKRNYFLFGFFGLYTLGLTAVAVTLFYTRLPDRFRRKITDRISLYDIPVNLVKGQVSRPELLRIDIKHKHMRKLAYVRAVSMEKNVLFDTEINKVPAVIRYGEQAYRVDLSVKGRLRDHWKDEDMLSFKVKVKDGKTIFGMRTFALQHPRTRFYINEWILHRLFSYAGLISLRYDFIAVDINGKGSRIYALEEGLDKRLVENNGLKEGPLLKFNRDFYWENGDFGGISKHGLIQDLWGADITPANKKQTFSDPALFLLFNKSKSLLEAFRRNRLRTSEVFDVEKLATYFALVDLIGYAHPSTLDNVRFYYNPITASVEPVIHDAGSFFRQKDRLRHPTKRISNGLLGTERKLGDTIVFSTPSGWKSIPWYEALFKDPAFMKAYIQALEAVSKRDFLDGFLAEIQPSLMKKRQILHRDYPLFKFDPIPILYENQQYIFNTLQPDKLIHVYYNKEKSSADIIHLDVTNAQNLPVEILGAQMNDSLELQMAQPHQIIQANIQSTPASVQSVRFYLPEKIKQSKAVLTITCRILGTDRLVETSVIGRSLIEGGLPAIDRLIRKPNFRAFLFLSVEEQHKRILFAEGSHRLEESLIIPEGYEVLANAGTQIDLLKGARIISNSPLLFIGRAENPIVFTSSDSTGEGITVVNATGESNLQHVHFNLLGAPEHEERGTVSFYRSPVRMDHCLFVKNQSSVNYVEVVLSNYAIANTVFYQTAGNAFHSGFSTGSIEHTRFVHTGGHAVDLVGSTTTIDAVRIEHSNGHGIIAAEKSTLEGRDIAVSHCDVALISRDLSKVLIDQVKVRDCKMAFSAIQTDPRFGPSTLEVENRPKISGIADTPYLTDELSKLRIAGKLISTGQRAEPVISTVKYGAHQKKN